MRNMYEFLFGYGQLSWKSRLSQPDHLYHQGRNFISLVLCGMYAACLLTLGGIPSFTPWFIGLPFWAHVVLTVLWILAALLPAFYVSFAAIKLTILRLHDFNYSGWWFLALIALHMLDSLLSRTLLPGMNSFFASASLAYLALLLIPANSAPNRFGNVSTNSTAGKARWIRAVPLVMFFVAWLLGMLVAFADGALQRQEAAQRAQFEKFSAEVEQLRRASSEPASGRKASSPDYTTPYPAQSAQAN